MLQRILRLELSGGKSKFKQHNFLFYFIILYLETMRELDLEKGVDVYFKDNKTGKKVKGILKVGPVELIDPITKKRYRQLVIEIVGEEG